MAVLEYLNTSLTFLWVPLPFFSQSPIFPLSCLIFLDFKLSPFSICWCWRSSALFSSFTILSKNPCPVMAESLQYAPFGPAFPHRFPSTSSFKYKIYIILDAKMKDTSCHETVTMFLQFLHLMFLPYLILYKNFL